MGKDLERNNGRKFPKTFPKKIINHLKTTKKDIPKWVFLGQIAI